MTVLKWDAAVNGEGIDLYATLGGSGEDMPGAEPGHRVEYFVGLQPGRDEIASALAALGLFARREGVLVDHGHTIPADGPLWPGSVMKTFLVLRQISDVMPALSLPGHLHVDFLQAVPIFDSERSFKIANGLEALLRRWEQRKTPFWDPTRRDGRLDG
ncbi:suppressor of fused domain protein [Kribbella sp. NPDC055071]